jgi:hypothetical protein
VLRIVTALTILIVLCLISSIEAEDKKFYAIDIDNDIYVIDSATKGVEKIHIDDVMNLTMVEISPTGRYLSWRALWLEPDTCLCEIKDRMPLILVVMDLERSHADTICNVMDYDWAPSEDILAYMISYKDDYGETITGYAVFYGGEVWLYDAVTEGRSEISLCEDGYHSVYWSKFGERLCITCNSGPVIAYDPETAADSVLWGEYINVSPDGLYGFDDIIEDEAELYDLEKQKRIPLIDSEDSEVSGNMVYAELLEWGKLEGKTIAYVSTATLEYIDCATGQMYKVIPPSPDIDPIGDLVGFREGRPVWAKITGDKAELFYY